MNYKIQGAIRRNKKAFIISLILWLFFTIVFVVPLTYGIVAADYIAKSSGGAFNISIFFERFAMAIQDVFGTIGFIFKNGYFGNFISTEIGFTIIFAIFFFIGFIRSAPKHEYSDIEHGSSDWSKGGEQYQILNKNKGIILAENNYLPVDKRGNVNVLVVGRFRFW